MAKKKTKKVSKKVNVKNAENLVENNEVETELDLTEAEENFCGMVRGEFSDDKRPDMIHIDIDGLRFNFNSNCNPELAKKYAENLFSQYK